MHNLRGSEAASHSCEARENMRGTHDDPNHDSLDPSFPSTVVLCSFRCLYHTCVLAAFRRNFLVVFSFSIGVYRIHPFTKVSDFH